LGKGEGEGDEGLSAACKFFRIACYSCPFVDVVCWCCAGGGDKDKENEIDKETEVEWDLVVC